LDNKNLRPFIGSTTSRQIHLWSANSTVRFLLATRRASFFPSEELQKGPQGLPDSRCAYKQIVYSFTVCSCYLSASQVQKFRKFAVSAAPKLTTTAEFAGSLGWDVKTQVLVECASICARTASCSSYRFNSSSGLCHISSFATAFANETGDVWIVG
ncbi:hypothetical protein BOX15_Mlig006881g1, partial [Macrostomum lignano]